MRQAVRIVVVWLLGAVAVAVVFLAVMTVYLHMKEMAPPISGAFQDTTAIINQR
jgi:hypothetical protein